MARTGVIPLLAVYSGEQRIVPFRLSAVVRREHGRWLLAHAHFSVGVPNDALGGEGEYNE